MDYFDAPASNLAVGGSYDYEFGLVLTGIMHDDSVDSIPIKLSRDGVAIGYGSLTGPFHPDSTEGYQIGLTLSINQPGTHEITVDLNMDASGARPIQETNYSNNAASVVCDYSVPAAGMDLVAAQMTVNQAEGADGLVYNKAYNNYVFFIENRGSQQVVDVPIRFSYHYGLQWNVRAAGTIDYIDPMTVVAMSISYPEDYGHAWADGSVHLLLFEVDYSDTVLETDELNNTVNGDYTVQPDFKSINGARWRNPNSLTLAMDSSAEDLLYNSAGLTQMQVENAVEAWNSISTPQVSYSTSLFNANIKCTTRSAPDDVVLAKALCFSELFSDYIGSAQIIFYYPNFYSLNQDEEDCLHTIVHEVGHTLGLLHPFETCECGDASVLNYDYNPYGAYSATIAEHDRVTLKKLYEGIPNLEPIP